ncbi:alpha/beta-hydrolase [Sporormia fimetaria CBS 119925]|uniref:Alpha/beta-hydrolase n=1 Tax=Sporormia fimetaria CBS 119925 TaxID=1340428 RepID=A0A6A6VKF9_9PLEO|nr:alpha/beta-hydrolase [Sporormia fimetaria CBS 119925]
MAPILSYLTAAALAFTAYALPQTEDLTLFKKASTCPEVINSGTPRGQIKTVSTNQIYQTTPQPWKNTNTAILFLSDVFGIPSLENRLLADSFANAGYAVIMPDLFKGDPITPAEIADPNFNITAWSVLHPQSETEGIIAATVTYMQSLGITKIGGVGYCFGGKYVPRHMAAGKAINVGFVAHPTFLTLDEIRAIKGPLSIAAGELDNTFLPPDAWAAEQALMSIGAIFQSNLYAKAPHAFAVKPNMSQPVQVYAKQESFRQAVSWFDAWLK